MSWVQCRFCINKYPPNEMFEGKCPECQADHLKAIAVDASSTRQLRSEVSKSSTHKPPMMSAEQAVIAAAQELASTESGANLSMVLAKAKRLRGKGISAGYLSPTGAGYHLRPRVEQILGIHREPLEAAPIEAVTAPEKPTEPSDTSDIERLEAEVKRLQAELAKANAPAPKPQPLHWVEGLRSEMERDRRTLERIERDQVVVQQRIAAAELLLGTLEGEPTEKWQVLQGGAAEARSQEVS